MKKIIILTGMIFCLAASYLHAWEQPRKGKLMIGDSALTIFAVDDKNRMIGGWKLEEEGLLLMTGSESSHRMRFHAELKPQASKNYKTLYAVIHIPVTYPKAEIDGEKIEFPIKYKAGKWILTEKNAKKLVLNLAGGYQLTVTGHLKVRVVDSRHFGQSRFSFRIYFRKNQKNGKDLTLDLALRKPSFYPLNIEKTVNAGFADEIADDGKGGWTDQGPENDLRVFRPGLLRVGGIAFQTIDPKKNNGKSVISLGRTFPKRAASIKIPHSGRFLYLLHAFCWGAPKTVGEICVAYADGKQEIIPVRNGKDIGDWWAPQPHSNAAVAWSGQNPSSFVGLYFSQFELRNDNAVNVEFRLKEPSSNWMIVAAGFADQEMNLDISRKKVRILAGREWIPHDPTGDVIPGTVMDFSCMLDAPAGKYGFLQVNSNGHFVFSRAREKRVRFVGTNLCGTANFLSRPQADALAERLARTGYNAVRLHHQDGYLREKTGKGRINAKYMDQLDYLFAALKKRGIYVVSDIYVHYRAIEMDGIPEADLKDRSLQQMKLLLPISAAARENWKLFARNWLTHRNPYTGLTWAEDPALIGLSLVNENNLFHSYNQLRSEKIRKIYEKKFAEWMKRRYPKERIPEARGKNRRFLQFLSEIQITCSRELGSFLKNELKFKGLYSDLNMCNAVPLALARADMDMVDDHKYHDHPRFPVNAWKLPNQYRQKSAVSRHGFDLPGELFAARLYGKPFSVTEYKFCAANRFRSEGGPLIGGYAALQNWDSLYQFAWAHDRKKLDGNQPIDTFDAASDSLSRLTDRITMFLFRRGDVAPAEHTAAWHVPADYWKTDQPLKYPVSYSKLGFLCRIGNIVGDHSFPGNVIRLSADKYREDMEFGVPSLDRLRTIQRKKNCSISDTGELKLDAEKGIFHIVSPRSEAVTLASGSAEGKVLSVSGAKTPQSIFVTSLDPKGMNLIDSKRILIFHLTNTANEGMLWSGEGELRLESWGTPKRLLRKAVPVIQLNLASGTAPKVTALQENGSISGPVSSTWSGNSLKFTADNARYPGGVIAYLIER